MMSAVEPELIVLAFHEEEKANQVLKDLRQLEKKHVIELLNAAVLVKNEKGKISVKETEDVDAGQGALMGAVVGGLVGFLGGPVGAVFGMVAGAATGGVAAHKIDMGFSDEFLENLEETLRPESSAIIAMIEHRWIDELLEAIDDFEGQLFRTAIKSELAAQLAAADAESLPEESGQET